ncbi:hypothetical protein MBEHAL_0498 [Halarchaeum acidiphilum MH1-52-1]|uniref:CAAX prenyl protease 2/Lysostaphin resistance protein A-like domain-containing protein n=1 Tax=Halarchaeum acidiphilum MH1-52-1 TaxID=1261545 RepID=U3AAE3_9EURY|nr:type II CAAX endopeptidase family protein [Halarchaeum acidiphilum]GAD51738.1 hypothetical protein MBEHAL_0498 [Halarchaeum acidiphilum MH1-52-1]
MARSTAPPDWGDRIRTFALATGVGLSGLVVGLALTLVVAIVFRLAGIPITPSLSIVLSTVLLQGVAFGSVAYAYARYRNDTARFLRFRLPSIREIGLAVAGWLAALAALLVISGVLQSTNAPTATNDVADLGMAHPEVLLLLVPLSFLLVGPGEELLFRGVVQGTLRERFGPVPGVLLASLVFAGVHFTSLSGSVSGRIVTIAALFVIALVLGGLYEYTGNLTVTALVHGAYNATQFGLLYLQQTHAAAGHLAPYGVHVGALASLVAQVH